MGIGESLDPNGLEALAGNWKELHRYYGAEGGT